MGGTTISLSRRTAHWALSGTLALALAGGTIPAAPPIPGPAAAIAQAGPTAPLASRVEAGAGTRAAPASYTTTLAAALTPSQRLARLNLEQRVGQVLMMGVPATGAGPITTSILTRYRIGNVFLKGRNYDGVASVRAVVARLNATVGTTTTGGQPRFVATDQEGGYVQALKGPGFSTMPTALHQGTWYTSTLRSRSETWARQLRSAGVNVNLAPVGDTVPSASFAPYNSPIGYWHREFGFTSWHVAADVNAFAQGMRAGGVAPVVKHFPGLGRVTRNTDTSMNVKDTITTRYSVYRRPFARAINYGTRWVMVSNAYYTQIDPHYIGTFSPTIMKTMLRHDMLFKGIVVSDDLCNAKQLSPWSLSTRAKRFFNAGGTMLLCVNASDIPAMHKALVAEAKRSPAFRAKINAAALEVLQTRAGQ